MKKFIVIYHADASAMKKMQKSSPEEMKKGMEPWMAWAKKCGGGLVDMGSPLSNGLKVGKNTSSQSKRNVVGYSVLQANNMKEASEMLMNHPHLGWADGCEIEVHETMAMPK
jgi:hypothetical protein